MRYVLAAAIAAICLHAVGYAFQASAEREPSWRPAGQMPPDHEPRIDEKRLPEKEPPTVTPFNPKLTDQMPPEKDPTPATRRFEEQ